MRPTRSKGSPQDRFGDALRGIVAQRLLPRIDGAMCAAVEVLVNTPTARESIKRPENNVPLKDVMERGVHPYGMRTFEMHIKKLVRAGVVSVETARADLVEREEHEAVSGLADLGRDLLGGLEQVVA